MLEMALLNDSWFKTRFTGSHGDFVSTSFKCNQYLQYEERVHF